MALDTLDKLVDAMANRRQALLYTKQSFTATTALWHSVWRANGQPCLGGTPTTTPTTCDSTTVGGIPFTNPTGGNKSYLGRVALSTSAAPSHIRIVDRLAHVGGLSGTVTTAQTFAASASLVLPTRGGLGDNVELWAEWYTATGASAANITVSYTNQAGTAGRTSVSTAFGVSTIANRMLPLPLQSGDTGVRSVQSVTLSATTGTAGNFGITLVKRIADVPYNAAAGGGMHYGPAELNLPEVADSACLMAQVLPVATASGNLVFSFDLIQG